MSAGRSSHKGFTYLWVLLAVAALGGGLAAFAEAWSHAAQREKEAELLFAGDEYRRAIAQYFENSPAGYRRYPERLEELLKDERFAFNRRYLRKLYRDPLTGGRWGVVQAPEGGIMGVYSKSDEAPLKTGNFAKDDQDFAKAERYSEWRFVYQPVIPAQAGTQAQAAAR
jgi:type II secretory pathway pseudopilin PulG